MSPIESQAVATGAWGSAPGVLPHTTLSPPLAPKWCDNLDDNPCQGPADSQARHIALCCLPVARLIPCFTPIQLRAVLILDIMPGWSRRRRQRQSKATASLRSTFALPPLFEIPVCKRWPWPLQGWHFETAKVNGGRFFPLKILSLGRDRRFGVRSYCVREERQVTLRLWSASALVSLRIFSPSNPKKWVSLACRWLHTCLILPYGRSCETARKTASPAGEAQRASNKREKINSNAQTSKDYASKKNESSRGQTAQYRAVPQFSPLRLH